MLKGFKIIKLISSTVKFWLFVSMILIPHTSVYSVEGDYSLIAVAQRGKRDFGIYYSKSKGEFLYKQVKRSRSSSPKFNFPNKLNFRDQSLNRPNGYRLNENKRYSANTLAQFDRAYRELLDDLGDHNVHLGTQIIAPHREALSSQMKDFIKVKTRTNGNNTKVAYFNFKTGELIYQELKNRNGVLKLQKEKFYDLNNQRDWQDARKELRRVSLLWEYRVDAMRSMIVGPCGQNALGVDLNINFNDFDQVTDELFKKYLENALSDHLVPLEGRNFVVKVSVLDKEYQLKVSYDQNGKVSGVKFMNENLARANGISILEETDAKGAKHFLLKAKDPSDDETRTWIALSSDEVRQTSNGPQGRLVLSVRGKKKDLLNYNGFEKSYYDVNFNNSMNKISLTGKRIRLTGEERRNYELPVGNGGNGGFLGFLFKTFYGQSGRHKVVKEKISEEAGKAILSNENFKHLTNQAEINELANRIATNVKLRTNNYSTSLGKIEAIAAEESYGAFAELLLRRTVASLLSEEKRSDLDSVLNTTLVDFKKCMRRGSDRRNRKAVEQCMLVFEKEAPVDLGRAVLDLKLAQNDMGSMKPLYVAEYNKCISERYDPLFKNPKAGEVVDGQDVIKGCVFQTLLITINQGIEPQLDQRIADLDTGDGPKITLSPQVKQSAIQTSSRCFQRKGLMSQGSYQLNFDFNYLSKLDPTKYEHDLTDCIDQVTLNVGRVVTKATVESQVRNVLKPEEGQEPIEGLDQLVDGISSHAVLNGYETCVRKQRQIIRTAKAAYQTEKEQLVNAALDPNNAPKPTTYVPTFDPLRCKELITSLTVERASFALIKEKLGAEKWDKLIEEADPVPSFISCYKSHQADVKSKFDRRFSSKPFYETYPPQRREEEKLKYEKKLEEDSERKNAACLKETIVWSSVHLAKDMLGVAITEMKADFGEINLSEQNLLLLSSKIQQCFKVEIESFNTISSVGDSIEPITNKCGMKLIIEDEDFKKLILKPIMMATLTESGIEGDKKDKYADALINDLRKFIEEQKVHNLEQFKTKASEYKVRGTVMIVEMVINDKIDEQFSGMKPDDLDAVKLELKPQIDKLINEGENSLKNKLSLVSQSEDPNASKKVMSEFTIDATRIVASRVLGFEKQKMVKEKILENSADADQFEQYAKGRLNNCLNNIDVNQPELVEGKLTTCTQDLKKDSITWVVDKRISKELKEPLLKDLFTEAELKSLKGNILNNEFKRKVHAISRMEDSDQASISLNLLVSDLTADATKKIASSVLPKTLSEVMSIEPGTSPTKAYVIKQRRAQISASAVGTFSSCIDKTKQKNKKVIHGEQGILLENGEAFDAKKAHNRCLNILRLVSSKGVLKYQYEQGLNFVDLDSPKRIEIINGKLGELNTCSNAIDLYSDSKSYSYTLEACLGNNALSFIRKTIEHGRNMAGVLIRQSSNTMTSFNRCLGGMRANAIESMKKFDPNNAELVSLSQRASGLTEEKFITESVILSSKLKESTGKPFPKVDVTWVTSQVKHCVFDDLTGNVLNEFKEGLASNPRFGLGESDKENITLLVDGFTEILKMPGPSDGHVRITNNAARERRSSAQNNTTPPSGGAPDKSTIDVLKDLLPTIVDYIKLVGKYDSTKSRTNLKLLLAKLKDKVRNNGGVMDMDEIIDITMKSELMDDIIRAVISKEVKVTAEKALRAFIPNRGQRDRVAKKLSSKAMINRIFSSTDPKARAILDSIKNDYIKKLIKGEVESSQGIPSSVMNKVKVHLASDTKLGGFAETVLAPIAQVELNNAQSGWGAGFGMLIGRVESKDFRWSTLRSRRGGANIINQFSTNILKPLLTDSLSDRQMESRKETLSGLIENVVKDNGQDYNPLW